MSKPPDRPNTNRASSGFGHLEVIDLISQGVYPPDEADEIDPEETEGEWAA